MSKDVKSKLVIIDEQFEKIEGHPYEYDKSVVEIFEQHGFETTIYGHKNMLPAFQEELKAKPWFTINKTSKIRKIPILGAIIYRTAFWKKYQREITVLIKKEAEHTGILFFFFPNVYWYNILPIARVFKKIKVPVALLYRTSVFDTIGLPKIMLPVTLRIIKYSLSLLKDNSYVHYFSDSEVIANEWEDTFNKTMHVLPIPHLTLNRKDETLPITDKVRIYLPGGMRIEKGVKMLTEAFELLAVDQRQLFDRIILVTQFGKAEGALSEYKARLEKLSLNNDFLQHLSTEEYNHQLSIADVILIPYQVSEGYRARTSGILAEAIASSKPFITTDGTWMSLQARKYNTGIIVKDNHPDELAQAIFNIVKDHSHYLSKANNACIEWMESQSKENFYRLLATTISE